MKPALITATITDGNGALDVERIRSYTKEVATVVSGGNVALVKVESSGSAKIHLEYAKRYSRFLSDLESEIRKTNCLLVIAALRSAEIPTHTKPFERESEAVKCLSKEKFPVACVF